jgi:hypothetical protein
MNPAELLAALRPHPSDGLSSINLRRQQLLLLESVSCSCSRHASGAVSRAPWLTVLLCGPAAVQGAVSSSGGRSSSSNRGHSRACLRCQSSWL